MIEQDILIKFLEDCAGWIQTNSFTTLVILILSAIAIYAAYEILNRHI